MLCEGSICLSSVAHCSPVSGAQLFKKWHFPVAPLMRSSRNGVCRFLSLHLISGWARSSGALSLWERLNGHWPPSVAAPVRVSHES